MDKILKFNEHTSGYKQAEELISMILNPLITEGSDNRSHITNILKGLHNDLKFNYGLVFTFGAGIKVMYSVVEGLIKNGNIKIELTPENIVLLSLTALAITYLEEKNNKTGDEKVMCSDCEGSGYNTTNCSKCDNEGCDDCEEDCEFCNGSGYIDSKVTKKDARTLLEELKLRGIGNGIVKKVVQCFKSIGNILHILFKNTPYVILGFLDMFAYTSILVPTMNAITSLINNYSLDMDTLPANCLSIGVGITTFLAKNIVKYMAQKLKDKFQVNPKIESLTKANPHDIKDGDTVNLGKSKLIREQ